MTRTAAASTCNRRVSLRTVHKRKACSRWLQASFLNGFVLPWALRLCQLCTNIYGPIFVQNRF